MPGIAPPRRPQRLAGLNNGRNGSIKPLSRSSQRDSACGCGSPSYEVIDGAKICLNCGTQISENNIVAEVTFGESSSGAATVDGARVGEDQRHANTLGSNVHRRMGIQSQGRADSELNGREAMRVFTGKLPVSPKTVEEALYLWKLASNDGFTRGRRAEEVAGACLYGACRRDKANTILLMDLAEVITVNVFSLGDTYKEMAKKLYLDVHARAHLVEVEPLILKYAAKLEFGEKTRQVAEDAVKIIRRMKRDWIVTGRHPAGLCGACIILAARMNNFRRTVREVVFVVKVADLTISKRLEEFKRTRSSFLTIDEFRSVGNRIKVQHDPPAIYEAKERARRLLEKKRKRLEYEQSKESAVNLSVGQSRQSSLAPSPSPAPEQAHLSFEQQEALHRQSQTPQPEVSSAPAAKKSKIVRKQTTATVATPREPCRDADGFVIPELPIDPALLAAANAAAEEIAAEDMTEAIDEAALGDTIKKVKRKVARPRKEKTEKEMIANPTPLTEEDLIEEEELQDEIENFLSNDECISKSKDDIEREKMEERSKTLAEQQRAITAAALAQRAESEGRRHYIVSDSETIGEDEFADDPEVQNALLTEAQVKVKEMIWVAHNEDWLRLQQTKQLKRALDDAEGKTKEKQKRKKRSRMGDGTVLEGGTPVESPADANRRMLEKRAPKQFSQRVNYAALGKIYNRGTPSEARTSASQSRAGSVAPSDAGAGAEQEFLTPPETQPGGDKAAEGEKVADDNEEEDEDEDDDPADYWQQDETKKPAEQHPAEDNEEDETDINAAVAEAANYGDDDFEELYEDEYEQDVGGDDDGFED